MGQEGGLLVDGVVAREDWEAAVEEVRALVKKGTVGLGVLELMEGVVRGAATTVGEGGDVVLKACSAVERVVIEVPELMRRQIWLWRNQGGRIAELLCWAMEIEGRATRGETMESPPLRLARVTGGEERKGQEMSRVALVCRELLMTSGRFILFKALLQIAASAAPDSPPKMLQSAVYLIAAPLWGPSDFRLEGLKEGVILSTVIVALRSVVLKGPALPASEVGVCLCRIIRRFGKCLLHEWVPILELLEAAFARSADVRSLSDSALELAHCYLRKEDDTNHTPCLAPDRKVLKVLDLYKNDFPEDLVIQILRRKAEFAEPWLGLEEWVGALVDIVKVYYEQEERPRVRKVALEIIRLAAWSYSGLYDDSLVDGVVLRLLFSERWRAETSKEYFHLSDELELIGAVAGELPISDIHFSSLVAALDKAASIPDIAGNPDPLIAVQNVARLFFLRMNWIPAGRAIVAFRSLVSIHMHSRSLVARKVAVHEAARISADAGYYIVAKGKEGEKDLHSRILVSHITQRRRAQESVTLLPIQLLVSNLLIRARKETDEDLLDEIISLLCRIFRSPFLSRDCDLRSLAISVCDDINDSDEKPTNWARKNTRARAKLFDLLHILQGYGVQRLGDENLYRRMAECTQLELRNLLSGLTGLSESIEPSGGESAIAILARYFTTAVVCEPNLTADLAMALPLILEHIDKLTPNDAVAVLEGIKVVGEYDVLRKLGKTDHTFAPAAADAIYNTLTKIRKDGSDPSSLRWRLICSGAFFCIIDALQTSQAEELLQRLQSLENNALTQACLEYGYCFSRIPVGKRSLTPLKQESEELEGVETASPSWIGPSYGSHMVVSVRSNSDGSADFVQRRSTGTTTFRVEFQDRNVRDLDLTALENALAKQSLSTESTQLRRSPDSLLVGNEAALSAESSEGKSNPPLSGAGQSGEPGSHSGLEAWEALRNSIPRFSLPSPVQSDRWLHMFGVSDGGWRRLFFEDPDMLERSLRILDRMPAENTHRIGVVYVGENTATENEILGEVSGSEPYFEFLSQLGQFVRLSRAPKETFTGGLDTSGRDSDGDYFLHWQDRSTQVTFHVTTLMPTHDTADSYVRKKRHVGNDHVNVIWIERGDDYDPDTLPGAFNSVHILVFPSGYGVYRVLVRVNNERTSRYFGPLQPAVDHVINARALGPLVRQTAINADIACSGQPASWEVRSQHLLGLARRNTGSAPQLRGPTVA